MPRAERLPLEALQPYLVEFPGAKGRPLAPGQLPPAPLDWHALFGNHQPVQIEVGFGKGLFLLSASQAQPDVNFLGIEIERKYQLHTATRLARRGIANVRLICGDARYVLEHAVPEGSVRAVHVYFPDPWWKKRHHKRRVFTADFAARCTRVLRPGGEFHVATDVADYFAVIRGLLDSQFELRESTTASAEPEHITNFERKYREAGKPIYRAAFFKTSDRNWTRQNLEAE